MGQAPDGAGALSGPTPAEEATPRRTEYETARPLWGLGLPRVRRGLRTGGVRQLRVMPAQRDWQLDLDVDRVLRGQGADPAMARRRPALVEVAERALRDGFPLLSLAVVSETYSVAGLQHERLRLQGGGILAGRLVAQHLRAAERVVVVVCTVGEALDAVITEVMPEDPVFALALDGLGSAAVESLAAAASHHFEQAALRQGLQTTIPLSPGMVGWPVAEGQTQIFSLVNAGEIGVRLNAGAMMIPRKSISLVLGQGTQVSSEGSTCDFCSLKETCRYHDHYA